MTPAQMELKAKHGTPDEFAAAVGKAVAGLTVTLAEGRAAVDKYAREWTEAGEDNWQRCLRLAREQDKDRLIQCLLVQVAKMRKPRERRVPLWSFVGEATKHGCGVSSGICAAYGVNPDSGEVREAK